MKVVTDPTHKSFVPKGRFRKLFGRIVQQVGIFTVIIGSLITLSGCSSAGSKTKKEKIEDLNKAWVQRQEENAPLMEMYSNGTLPEQDLDSLNMYYLPTEEDFIDSLPPDLKTLNIFKCSFIKDLSKLPYVCPELERLTIGRCYALVNFDFIKELKNLKSFTINGETVGVTDDLIAYLDSKGIQHNLGNELVSIDQAFENIIKSIITDDMSEDEKINAIVNYVVSHMEYDKSAVNKDDEDSEKVTLYNEEALSSFLKGKGVCANYTAASVALYAKTGGVAYYVSGNRHAWLLVKIDEKYYYVDPTQLPGLAKKIMEWFGTGFFYKQDPYNNFLFSGMVDIDEITFPSAPDSILKKIDISGEEKSTIEKYGSNIYVDLGAFLVLLLILEAVGILHQLIDIYGPGLGIFKISSQKKNDKTLTMKKNIK